MLLRGITESLDDSSKEAMEEVMKERQQQKQGASTYDAGSSGSTSESNVTLPLGSGEWDEPLGLPVCVVCHNVCHILILNDDHACLTLRTSCLQERH